MVVDLLGGSLGPAAQAWWNVWLRPRLRLTYLAQAIFLSGPKGVYIHSGGIGINLLLLFLETPHGGYVELLALPS